jgi:hypothetical protein
MSPQVITSLPQFERKLVQRNGFIDQKQRDTLAQFDIRFTDQVLFLAGLQSQRNNLAKALEMTEKELDALVNNLRMELSDGQVTQARIEAVKQFSEQALKPSDVRENIWRAFKPDLTENAQLTDAGFPDYHKIDEEEDETYPEYQWEYDK